MKKQFSILSVLFVLSILFVLSVLYQPALGVENDEDENTPKQVTEETIAESLKEKLEEVSTEEKLEKAKSVLAKKDGFYAYVGTISEVEEGLITIETKKGDRKAQIDDESTLVLYKDKKETPIKPKDIETNSYAIAMGKMQDEEIIQVVRMMVSEKPAEPPEKKAVFGKIEEIDEKRVKIKNKEELELNIPKNLNLKISSVKKPEISDIEIEDKGVFVLQKEEDEKNYTLLAMFIIPGKNSPESEKNQLSATESAKIASPSAEETSEQ